MIAVANMDMVVVVLEVEKLGRIVEVALQGFELFDHVVRQ
jgi:hypothetical protein